MKILFCTMNWYPFEGSATHIFAAILEHLRKNGHEITILTSIPYFMNSRPQVWPQYGRKLFVRQSRQGIDVRRVYVFSPRFLKSRSMLLRGLNCISYAVHSFLVSLFVGKFDLIMTVSHPPLLAGITASMISALKRCPSVYCLEDIYPDILADLGVVKDGWFLRLLRKLEKRIYRKASAICVLSEQMKANLLTKGVDGRKVEVVPHFADSGEVDPFLMADVAERFDLNSAFTVLLPGSLSYRCGIDNILRAAELLKDDRRIRFVLIDRGELREQTARSVRQSDLDNVQFVPFLPAEEFLCLLRCCGAGLVSLDHGFGGYSVPSKLFQLMQNSRPVIAVADKTSEIARIVRDADCGLVVEPSNPAQLAEAVVKTASEPHQCLTMGQNALRYVDHHFNRNTVCLRYQQIVQELTDRNDGQ
jgi:colanic acid biosynthesis glycosyl transferase WcaI